MGVDEELDRTYGINIQSEYPEYRLFLEGSATPIAREVDGFDLDTWISMKTGYEPLPDYVYHLNDDTYTPFLKKTKYANAFIMLYTPQNPKCQETRREFMRVADAFHVPLPAAPHP